MIDKSVLEELKHSIKLYLLINGGTSQLLCSYTIKLIDFLSEDIDHTTEAAKLSYAIAESTAISINQHIDYLASKTKGEFPKLILNKGNEILIAMGKCRILDDKIAAKYIVLKSAADAIRSLSTYTKSPYPKLFNLSGAEL